jgi:hypothetical protein
MNEQRNAYIALPAVEWEDPDENDGQWPYPSTYEQRELTGPLADAVRRRLGVPSTTPVLITEAVHNGGYSEYTQENDYVMTIDCGGVRKEFDQWSAEDNFAALLKWLDGAS